MNQAGTLVLVVGPSGAGKDTVIAGVRAELEGDARFHFPTRVVTRRSDATETVTTLTPEQFAEGEKTGAFALAWRAHGHAYAIPAQIRPRLAAGAIVICNVSRTVLAHARNEFEPVDTVLVTAPPGVIAQRIAARGRETSAELETRARRAGLALPADAAVTTIENVGPPGVAIGELARHLQRLSRGPID